MDAVADIKGKEVKRATLNELVDYITGGRGVLTEPVYPEIIKMVRNDVFLCAIFKLPALCGDQILLVTFGFKYVS